MSRCLDNVNIDTSCVELKILNDITFNFNDDNFIDITPGVSFEDETNLKK